MYQWLPHPSLMEHVCYRDGRLIGGTSEDLRPTGWDNSSKTGHRIGWFVGREYADVIACGVASDRTEARRLVEMIADEMCFAGFD